VKTGFCSAVDEDSLRRVVAEEREMKAVSEELVLKST
jgi:hypothetical protein